MIPNMYKIAGELPCIPRIQHVHWQAMHCVSSVTTGRYVCTPDWFAMLVEGSVYKKLWTWQGVAHLATIKAVFRL